SAVSWIAAVACGEGGTVPAGTHDGARTVAGAVMPGGFDKKPADVSVAGLGHRALNSGPSGGELAGNQPDEGPDGVAGEPVPVTDLDREPEGGQRGDPAQARQPSHDRGEFAVRSHLLDRLI